MKLLDDLIAALSGEKPSLTDALIKTKVLLHRIGRKELANWSDLELNGYPKDAVLPSYRMMSVEVKGTVSNGVYTYDDELLSLAHLNDDLRRQLRIYEVRQSISALEKLAEEASKNAVGISIAPEFNGLLSKPLTETYSVQRAWRSIGIGQIEQVFTQIRSRLLDFLLELDEKVEQNMTDEEVRTVGRSSETFTMFEKAIFGDNVTILIGDHNRQNVTNQVIKGDFESLKSILTEKTSV